MVESLLNPAAFMYKGRVGLLLRVAERPPHEEGWVSTPLFDPQADGGVRILRVRRDDPDLKFKSDEPRIFEYRGHTYLTTLSHLRLAWSDDGRHFQAEQKPTLVGEGEYESFGIEDCRVTELEGRFILTYSAVSSYGVGVGMASTSDWRSFQRLGMILPPHNKDCAVLPRRAGGLYQALHRPSGVGFGGNNIWIASSPDLINWGSHRCLAATRDGHWDAERIGAGAAPIETPKGWLEIYHGANAKSRYCLGALLLDLENPQRVIARSDRPIMEPLAPYELTGFFGNVVFTNGQVVRGDEVTVYYGAADSVVCGATFSIRELIDSLPG